MNNIKSVIGSRIREARIYFGMSQFDLARAVGFKSATAISLIECGDRRITAENLTRIATVLKEDVRFLLGIDPAATNIFTALRQDEELENEDKEFIRRYIEHAKERKVK